MSSYSEEGRKQAEKEMTRHLDSIMSGEDRTYANMKKKQILENRKARMDRDDLVL